MEGVSNSWSKKRKSQRGFCKQEEENHQPKERAKEKKFRNRRQAKEPANKNSPENARKSTFLQ
jgi:hypothetical protein